MSSDSIDTDELEAEMKRQKRKKQKKDKHKHKSKKKSKKRKKKRAKSYSSIDSMSDDDVNALLDRRYTPPTAPSKSSERTVSAGPSSFTPHNLKENSSPATPPPTRRTNSSNNTFYGESSSVETANASLGSNLQVTVTNKQTISSRHRSPQPSSARISGNGSRFGNSPRTPPPSHYTSSSGGGLSGSRDSRSSRYVQSPHKEDLSTHHRSSHEHGFQSRYSATGPTSHDARKVKRLSPGRFNFLSKR